MPVKTLAASPTLRVPARRLEVTLATLVAISVLLIFWSQQRYPALLKRLHAGTSVRVAGAISFDTVLPVRPEMPAPERIARTTVNWLWTNRFGMYFALPFGAAAMTLLGSSAAPRRFASPTVNVLCGVAAGAPLGVCTNCATPVAQSLIAGGASTRLTMAALISSPSFNPVVVAMAFVLFPLPLAAMRLAVSALVLLALPWIVEERSAAPVGLRMPLAVEPLSLRLRNFLATYGRNLLRITLMTLPWMLLAAILGATASELVPAYGTHLPVSITGILAVAVFGTLLPVPMALDVALAYVLMHAGVPLPYVATLLCTLGPVSIYSLSAMASQLGRGVSLRLGGLVATLGAAAGFVILAMRHAW